MRNKLKVSLNIGSITKWMIVGGILLIILAYIPFGKLDKNSIIIALKGVFQSLGTTVFSAGLVSVVLEISTVSEVVKKAVDEIISEKFPYNNFSKDRLEEINKQIAFLRLDEKELLSEKDMDDSPYNMEPELLELSKGLYYEYHKAKFVITAKEEGVFKKRVEFDYKIINKLGCENCAKFTVSLICQKDTLTIEEVKKYFKIELFKIEESDKVKVSGKRNNEKDLTKDAINYLNITEVEPHAHSQYKYEIHFEYPLSKKVANRIRLIYEYQIPQSDITQSYKLNYPSKILEHEISIVGDKWEITGDAFTAFYFPDMYDKEYTVSQTVSTSIRIDFRDWAVPGAGYIVTFLKK